MPAVSKAQQRFMGMVRATQKGEMENPSQEVLDAAKSMKKKDAKDFASTKHKGLPEKKMQKEERGDDSVRSNNARGNGRDGVGTYTCRPTSDLTEQRFCELCGKMEYREECSYGPKMWDMFTIRNFSKSVPVPGKATYEEVNWRQEVAESYLRIQERGRTYTIIFNWRGRTIKVQMFFDKFSRPTREEVRAELNKVYPGQVIVLYYNPSKKEPTLPFMFAGDAGNESGPRRN